MRSIPASTQCKLKLAKDMRELDFGALMQVYEEGNLENGAEFYPNLSGNEQLIRAQEDFYAYLRECFFQTDGAVYAIWEGQGRYLSALRLEPWQDGLLLEALETAPDLRGRGYAKALIRSVLGILPEQTVYSHVSKKNTASLAVHAACGFEKCKEYAVYADGSVRHNSYTLRWKRQ